MEPTTLYWLAGLLEGEGSFMAPSPSSPNSPKISLNMCDEDIVIKVAELFGVKYHPHCHARAKRNGWTPSYRVQLGSSRAVALMRELRPLMGIRRKQQIDRALSGYRLPNPARRITIKEILTIREEIATGKSVKQVAKERGLHYTTVRRIKNKRRRFANV